MQRAVSELEYTILNKNKHRADKKSILETVTVAFLGTPQLRLTTVHARIQKRDRNGKLPTGYEEAVEMVTAKRNGEETTDRNSVEPDNKARTANPPPLFPRPKNATTWAGSIWRLFTSKWHLFEVK